MLRALRESIRAWKGSAGVAAIATLSLALGIGATTAFYSIVDHLLLRPLPVPDPQHLVALSSKEAPYTDLRVSFPVWEQIRLRGHLFDGAFAWWSARLNLAPRGEVEMAETILASGGMFRTLRVQAAVGRLFDERDDARDGGPDGPAAVISHAYWRRQFGGAPGVIGRTIRVEDVPFTIVGVAAQSFHGVRVGSSFDLVLPLSAEPRLRREFSFVDNGRISFLRVVMRLVPNRPAEAVAAALRADQPAIRAATISTARPTERDAFLRSPFVVTPAPGGGAATVAYYGGAAVMLLGLGALVLLACCGNVATVVLAHGARRHYELGVRLALGASRWEAARQLLADSLALSALGAAAALPLAMWVAPALVGLWNETGLDIAMASGSSWRVWAFATSMGLLTGVLCGLAAAWRATRIDPAQVLTSRGPHHSTPERVQRALVATQLALSVVVLVVSTLLVRSYGRIMSASVLARLDGVVVGELRLLSSKVPPGTREDMLDRIRAAVSTPGVVASVAMTVPFFGGAYFWAVEPLGPASASPQDRSFMVDSVTTSHFDALGIERLAGRLFDERDIAGNTKVGIVNRTFAQKFLGGESRVPQRIQAEGGRDARREVEVIGVVEDIPYESLVESPTPALYLARTQEVPEDARAYLVVRPPHGTTASPADIRAQIAAAAPQLSFQLVPITQPARDMFARERMTAIVAAFFLALSALIGGMGIFGVTSHAVTARQKELGIRLALGAPPRRVLTLVMKQTARLTVVGIAAGLLASWWATRLITTLLVATDAHDITVFLRVAVAAVAVTTTAAWWPARRASRLDPVEILRSE